MTHFTEIQDKNMYCIIHTHTTSTSKLGLATTTVVRL